MDDSTGGRGSIALAWLRCGPLGEGFVGCALLISFPKPLGLEIKHSSVAAAQRHQFVVCAEFDYAPMLQNTNAIRITNHGEPMRDQDSRRLPSGCEQALEDLRLAAHIELSGGLIEQHHARSHLHRD